MGQQQPDRTPKRARYVGGGFIDADQQIDLRDDRSGVAEIDDIAAQMQDRLRRRRLQRLIRVVALLQPDEADAGDIPEPVSYTHLWPW